MNNSNKLTVAGLNTKFILKLDLCKVISKQSKSLQSKTHLAKWNYVLNLYRCIITCTKAY